MISTLLIDGAVKLVEIIRYRNKPATTRVHTPGNNIPDKILCASKYNDDRFIDDETGVEYRNTKFGMVRI